MISSSFCLIFSQAISSPVRVWVPPPKKRLSGKTPRGVCTHLSSTARLTVVTCTFTSGGQPAHQQNGRHGRLPTRDRGSNPDPADPAHHGPAADRHPSHQRRLFGGQQFPSEQR